MRFLDAFAGDDEFFLEDGSLFFVPFNRLFKNREHLSTVRACNHHVDKIFTDLKFPQQMVNLNINNILQYNYVELIGNIMPPRTYVLSLEAKL